MHKDDKMYLITLPYLTYRSNFWAYRVRWANSDRPIWLNCSKISIPTRN